MLQPSRTHAPTLARAVWIRKTVEMNRQTAHEMLKQAFTAAGLNGKLATYSLRKSFAQRVYEQSGNIYLVQELLGHRSVSTTQKYLGANYATAREFVEVIAIGYERGESRKTSRSSIQDVHIFPKPCKDHNSKTKYAKDTDIYYTGHF